MSDTEAETVMDLGEFIVDLKNSDPEIGQILDDIITEYEHFATREQRKRESVKKYFQSDKGRKATQEASKRYYHKTKTTTRKPGRPRKIRKDDENMKEYLNEN